MNADDRLAGGRDALLDAFVADLTSAAYHVALRRRVVGSWVDLQLDLWAALSQAVTRWGSHTRAPDRHGAT